MGFNNGGIIMRTATRVRRRSLLLLGSGCLLLSLLLGTTSFALDNWHLMQPIPWPEEGRFQHATCYTGDGAVLLFGGESGGILGDSRIYRIASNTWQSVGVEGTPNYRDEHAMAYCGHDNAVMFGGMFNNYSVTGDTWVFDLSARSWTQVNDPTAPSARYRHAMAYVGGTTALLYGGRSTGVYSDTWLFQWFGSSSQWLQLFPPSSPGPVYDHAMAHIGDGKVLLYGGGVGTWLYDNATGTWTAMNPPNSPGYPSTPVMAYIGMDQVLLVGQSSAWVYDLSDNQWYLDSSQTFPYDQALSATSYEHASRAVMTGGNFATYPNHNLTNETWAFGGGDRVEVLTITAPNGGETWDGSTQHSITWSRSGPQSATVNIDLSTDGGLNWLNLFDHTPNDGSETWTVLEIPSTQCYVRVLGNDYDGGDQSNAAFTITGGIDWAAMIGPASVAGYGGVPTESIYGQVRLDGITNAPGATPGMAAAVCYGPVGSIPSFISGWQFCAASYHGDAGDADEFVAPLTINNPGEYDYCFVFYYYSGPGVFADLDGSTNGYSAAQAGRATITGISWANLQGPAVLQSRPGCAGGPIAGRVLLPGLSSAPGATPGLVAEVGYGPYGTYPEAYSAPNPSWQWSALTFQGDVGGMDEFLGSLSVSIEGLYPYCVRFSYCGGPWVFGDLDGASMHTGYALGQSGFVTVAQVDAVRLQAPPSIGIGPGGYSPPVYGRVLMDPMTYDLGPITGLVGEVGFGPDGSDPAGNPTWQWVPATFNGDTGEGYDEFVGGLHVLTAGEYDYCFRFSYGACQWSYADLDGSANGYSAAQAGALSVVAGSPAGGQISAWGSNTFGECDVPDPNQDFADVGAGMAHSVGLKATGSIVCWGSNKYGQCVVPSPNEGFQAVAAGRGHNLGLKVGGSVVCWGANDWGQCSVPAPNTGFADVAGGGQHSLGLKEDGSIVCWGYNAQGQCTVPAPNTHFTAVAAGALHSMGLKDDGSVVCWGDNVAGQCTVPSPNAGFIAIAAGFSHSLGLKEDGSIVCWGSNGQGQGTVPSPNSGFTAVAAGSNHSLGLKSDHTVVAWGDNSSGQCDVPLGLTFLKIAGGAAHSAGVVLGTGYLADVPAPPISEPQLRVQPNPFNPRTSVCFSLPQAQQVRLAVFDLTGRLVRVLVNEVRAAGDHEVVWDGTSDRGQQVAAGVYVCRMQAGVYSETRRVTLVK